MTFLDRPTRVRLIRVPVHFTTTVGRRSGGGIAAAAELWLELSDTKERV